MAVSAKRVCEPAKWNAKAGRAIGNKEEVKSLNAYLDTLQRKVYDAHRYLLDRSEGITAERIKNVLLGVAERSRMILEIFAQHNTQMETLVGQGYAPRTLNRYQVAREHTRTFIHWKYKVTDLEITKLNYEFISEFEFYLRSVRRCAHNSAMKYLTNFKKIVLGCVKKGWLPKDPFYGFNLACREVAKPFLSQEELDRMAQKVFATERLRVVRDIFLFSCYTGLAYVDVHKLRRSEIAIGMDGEKWIFTQRQKQKCHPAFPCCRYAWRYSSGTPTICSA